MKTEIDMPALFDIEIPKRNSQKSKDGFLLYLTALGASLLIVGVGANNVWTSPVLLKLKSNDTNLNPLGHPISTHQEALLAGLVPFGGMLSPMFLTKFCDIIGRKNTIMLLSAFLITADVVLAFSSNIWIYYISRLVIGLCMGGALASLSVFLSEISEDHNRGIIGSFLGLFMPFGSLCAYALGPLFSVKYFTLLCSVPNIVNIVCCLIFIPETPFYLALKGNKEDTIRSLRRIRKKNSKEINEEYEEIIKTLRETSGNEDAPWGDLFKVKSLRRGFIIAMMLTFLAQVTGISVMLKYAGPLFDASHESLSGDDIGAIVGFVKLIGSLISIFVIEGLGRRLLLIISSLGVFLSNFSLGLYFFLRHTHFLFVKNIIWLPIMSVITFLITYSLGYGVIPVAIMVELFPSNIRSKTSSSCCTFSQALSFAITAAFPFVRKLFGTASAFWFFSFISLLGFFYVYFEVPEIKGKSLIEVQKMLSK